MALCYVTIALGCLDCTSVPRTLWLRILNVYSPSATGCLCNGAGTARAARPEKFHPKSQHW